MFPIDLEKREQDFAMARAFVKSQRWIFAKTYAKTTPHEYIVVRNGDTRREKFKMMFEMIEKYGKPEKFYGKDWIYLYLGDGYKYFAADGGGWADDRYILNRAKAGVSYGEQN